MKDWFNERYTKETPIEEQIRGRVRAECHYMDKADIYEWITQNEIKIMNLQSKIDKVNNYIDGERKKIQQHQYSIGIRRLNKIQDILKEDK